MMHAVFCACMMEVNEAWSLQELAHMFLIIFFWLTLELLCSSHPKLVTTPASANDLRELVEAKTLTNTTFLSPVRHRDP